jgi:N-formylmaleamate deformylase
MKRLLSEKGLKAACLVCCYLAFAVATFARSARHSAFTVKVTGKGQPMIVIPGATCSGDVYNATVAHYARSYQCHVLTLAGYAGAKPLSNGPYLETMKKQIERYITDNNLNNAILVGHSVGGFLALCIASEMSDHLQKAIIIDALPFFALTMNPNAADTFSESRAQSMLAMYSKMDDNKLRETQLNTARFLCADSTKWDLIASWCVASDKKTMAYTITEMMSADIRKKISNIHIPVLVLAAYAENPIYPGFTRASVVNAYTDQYKDCSTCKVNVAQGGTKHFIMFDNPTWYFSEIDNFVKN